MTGKTCTIALIIATSAAVLSLVSIGLTLLGEEVKLANWPIIVTSILTTTTGIVVACMAVSSRRFANATLKATAEFREWTRSLRNPEPILVSYAIVFDATANSAGIRDAAKFTVWLRLANPGDVPIYVKRVSLTLEPSQSGGSLEDRDQPIAEKDRSFSLDLERRIEPRGDVEQLFSGEVHGNAAERLASEDIITGKLSVEWLSGIDTASCTFDVFGVRNEGTVV